MNKLYAEICPSIIWTGRNIGGQVNKIKEQKNRSSKVIDIGSYELK